MNRARSMCQEKNYRPKIRKIVNNINVYNFCIIVFFQYDCKGLQKNEKLL